MIRQEDEMAHTDQIGHYKILRSENIGSGKYGKVFKGESVDGKEQVAIKQIDIQDERHRTYVEAELDAMKQLRAHRNVVKLLDYQFDDDTISIVMELCNAGNLDSYFKTANPDLQTQINIMFQCAQGLEFMHTQKDHVIIHRDIKPGNILVTEVDGKNTIRISDFGFAALIEAKERTESTEKFTTYCGTKSFMAPEFFDDKVTEYTKRTDIFSLGLCYLSMIRHIDGERYLKPRSDGSYIGEEMYKSHEKGEPMPEFVTIYEGDPPQLKRIKRLIMKMTRYEQRDRIDATETRKELEGLAKEAGDDVVFLQSENMSDSWSKVENKRNDGEPSKEQVILTVAVAITGVIILYAIDHNILGLPDWLIISPIMAALIGLAFLYGRKQRLPVEADSRRSRTNVPKTLMPTTIRTMDGIIHFMPRAGWGANPPKEPREKLILPLDYVIISHSGDMVKTDTTEECCRAVKSLQDMAVNPPLEWADIAYNILICNDGVIYEGRGVSYVSSTAKGWNRKALGIGFVGKYVDKLPSDSALDAAKSYLNYLVDTGVLNSGFTVHMLCDVSKEHAARYPSMFNFKLYEEVSSWKGDRHNWKWRPGEGTPSRS